MQRRETDVAVVGGGISGLATAHFLSRRGYTVTVVEKAPSVGGSVGTTRCNGFLIEHGPNSVQDTTPRLRQMCSELELGEQMVYPGDRAKSRYVVRGGRLHAMPMSPPALIRTGLLSTRAKLRLLAEPFIRRGADTSEESLAEFTQRRLGPEFLEYAIDPFVSGVYAGLPEELSVRAGFPRLHRLEQRYGSLITGAILSARERRKSRSERGESKPAAPLFSFAEGMQTLVDRLAARLGNVCTSTAVRHLEATPGGGFRIEADAAGGSLRLDGRILVLAVPAHTYGDLGLRFDFPAREDLLAITYPPVTSVFFGYRQSPGGRDLDGFGFLVPRLENRRILGTIWNSSLFAGRAPEGGAALTTFVGGRRQPELAELAEEELTAGVRDELSDLLGIKRPPDEVAIRRWPRAIPQYNVGHHRLIERVEECERQHPGLYVSGNFRGGISVGDCVERAHELSARIAAAHP